MRVMTRENDAALMVYPARQPPILFAIPAFPGAAKRIMVPASLRPVEAAYQTRSKA
jgi:hypothetical protein